MIRASTASRFCPAPCSLNISQKIPPSDSCFILQLHNTSAPSSSAPICLSRQTDRRSLEILCVGISTAIAIAIGTGTRTGIGPPHCSTHHQPVAKPPPPNYHFDIGKAPALRSPAIPSEMARHHEIASFSITQNFLGSPLQFTPASGTKELDDLISRYIPGHLPIQQKRAQVALEFFNHVDASPSHPVSRVYHVPAKMTVHTQQQQQPPALLSSFSSSSESLSSFASSNMSTPVSSQSSGSKRARDESSPPSATGSKRLPGFSIMTRDGVDITEYASRGPKTKAQRDHAALMRKLKACPACKRSKQRVRPPPLSRPGIRC